MESSGVVYVRASQSGERISSMTVRIRGVAWGFFQPRERALCRFQHCVHEHDGVSMARFLGWKVYTNMLRPAGAY